MLQFLKLGGSLITDKNQVRSFKTDVIRRLADEIHQSLEPGDFQLLLGHGSGSFGHIAAKKYQTRHGVRTREEWLGFVEVWRQARDLNNLVLESIRQANLPAIGFPPSAFIQSHDGVPKSWNIHSIQSALAAGLIPVVNGDVIFDSQKGGTIFSTEDVFLCLTREIIPDRILLCGLEEGVWLDYPACTQLQRRIDLNNADEILTSISGSAGIDVTGGMVEKVRLMVQLIRKHPNLQALIFSGMEPGNLYRALRGEEIGTVICSGSKA